MLLGGWVPGGAGAQAQVTAGGQSSTAAADVVAGQVVNGISGAPVSRALVQLGARAMLADGEGRFRFEQAGQPPSVIRATKPGYSISPEQFDGGSAATSGNGDPLAVVVTLWPEALLTGTVLAPDGEPLPHIAVQARRSVFDEQGHRFQQAGQSQTDSHGEFRIPVTAGDYVVESQFSQRGFERDEAVLPAAYPPALSGGTAGTVHLLPGQEAHLELRPGVSRTHVVTLPFDSDSDGGPPPRITVRSSTGVTFPASGFRSQEAGAVRLNLPPGSYALHATRFGRDGVQFGDSSITVGDRDVAGPALHLSSLPNIPVEVVTDGSATASASATTSGRGSASPPNVMQLNLELQPVEADPSSPFQNGVRPTQGRDGTASFAAAPGTYRLNASWNSGWYIVSATSRGSDLLTEPLLISASSSPSPITVTVSNQTGALQGTVALAGAPAACWIYLLASGSALPKVIVRRSDSSGAFNIPDLPPGSYRVIAFPYRHSLDLEDAKVLDRFATQMGSVSVGPGSSETLDLRAVTAKEMLQ